MKKEDIYNALILLNEKLKEKEIRGEIFLYGGTVMCLCLNARNSTYDIDALFEPKTKIYELAKEIAEEKGLNENWLNDGVKGFVSDKDEMELFENMSNLDIYNAKYEYLFAMKCMACRLEESSNDRKDIEFLIKYLNIQNVEEAEKIILKYFPQNLITPKTHFMLEEFFSNN